MGATRKNYNSYSSIYHSFHRYRLVLCLINFNFLIFYSEKKCFSSVCICEIAGVMNSLFSVYGTNHPSVIPVPKLLIELFYFNWLISDATDIYDDLISRRVNSSDAEKFAEVCPCPCNGVGWGVIWWDF